MKFLLELVPFCGSSQQQNHCETPRTREETRSLVPENASRLLRRRRRRGRVGSEWKPSLGAIAEDKAVAEAAEKAKVGKSGSGAAGERQVKRKSGGGGGHVRGRGEDFRRNSLETIIPAFSPTPFMF